MWLRRNTYRFVVLCGLLASVTVAGIAGQPKEKGQPSPSAQPKSDLPPDIPAPNLSSLTACPVVEVVDGNTIVASVAGKNTTVRLIGVGAPGKGSEAAKAEPYSQESTAFLENLLTGESVFLVDNDRPPLVDPQYRTLCFVYRAPDGLFVNAESVRQGYGRANAQYAFKYLEQFRKFEQNAKSAKKGLWSDRAKSQEQPPAQQTPTPVPAQAPEKKADAPATPDPATITVYVTKSGTKYHRAGCRYLAKSSIPLNLKDAKGKYSPCSVCNPPE